MKMVELLSFLAMVMFIPLRSRQHFIPFTEINQCLMADICNHTWITECGYYEKRKHTRLFIDECDMYEYNCDNNMRYVFTNYSECFGVATCPSVPRLLTRVQGFYIYYADGRRMLYHPPGGKSKTKHMFPFETKTTETTFSTNYNPKWRYTPQKTGKYKPWTDPETPCGPCGRLTTQAAFERHATLSQFWPPLEPPTGMFFPWLTKSTTESTTKSTTESTTKRTTESTTKRTTESTTKRTKKRTTKTKPTTQIFRTGTIGTIVLKKVTVWKNGKKFYKVVKGYDKGSIITTNDDSDFIE